MSFLFSINGFLYPLTHRLRLQYIALCLLTLCSYANLSIAGETHAPSIQSISQKHNHDEADHNDSDHDEAEHQDEDHDGADHKEGDHDEAGHKEDEHGHGEHEEEGLIKRLSLDIEKEMGIVVHTASPRQLTSYLNLTGEVNFNQESLAHLLPKVNGTVISVHKKLGDKVKKGDVMARFVSRELADIQANYLAAVEKLSLARDNYQRQAKLLKKGAIAERNLFETKQQLAEAQIQFKSTRRQLYALGFNAHYIKNLNKRADDKLTDYTMLAPTSGYIVEKHITLGEVFNDESRNEEARTFTLADLSTMWVDFTVYPEDIAKVKIGQSIDIFSIASNQHTTGTIFYISPKIDKETRTALVRARIDNPDKIWRSGLFVTGNLAISTQNTPIAVSQAAIVKKEGKNFIFLITQEGYELTEVHTGRADNQSITILAGLKQGQTYVEKGAFLLKSELDKASFGSGHSH